jgi:hypothetical protein
MEKPKGGRGKKAPYQTTHIRVPLPLKAEIEKLIEDYRRSLENDVESEDKKD